MPVQQILVNRLLPNCFEPHYESEARYIAIHVKSNFVCILIKLVFIIKKKKTQRGSKQLGNGLLCFCEKADGLQTEKKKKVKAGKSQIVISVKLKE